MQYFIINSTVANVYKDPSHQTEVITQALLGESCEIIDVRGDWYKIKQWDDYNGWIYHFNGVFNDTKYDANTLVTDLHGEIQNNDGKIICKLVFGNRLRLNNQDGGFTITLPDGRVGFSKTNMSKQRSVPSRQNIIDCAKQFIGVPYLWGGKTPYGMDCSGLVQTVFKSVGIELPRDSHQQYGTLQKYEIDENDLHAGDLLFFGEKNIIDHVAIALGDLKFINARGYVRIESIDEKNSLYNSKLRNLFLHGISVKELVKK